VKGRKALGIFKQVQEVKIARIERGENDFIWTVSGKQFWPLDPRADEICIEDIAHALSNVCRFTGHASRFYSVAEHSCHVANLIGEECKRLGRSKDIPQLKMAGLLHDASEAYLCDLSGPIKGATRFGTLYKRFEAGLQSAVEQRFGCPSLDSAIVRWADKVMLAHEMQALIQSRAVLHVDVSLAAGADMPDLREPWTPSVARCNFLEAYAEIRAAVETAHDCRP
jgi:5'-deoxynucleotidase YfbR-like HD superfamily hydrolase